MSFTNFLNEFVQSASEVQNPDARADAKTIVAKTRGLMPGRLIDANGNTKTSSAIQNNQSAITPNPIQDNGKTPVDNISNEKDLSDYSMVLKNNSDEIVYVTKDNDKNVYITIVNKRRQTKRTISLETRGSTLLKRFI